MHHCQGLFYQWQPMTPNMRIYFAQCTAWRNKKIRSGPFRGWRIEWKNEKQFCRMLKNKLFSNWMNEWMRRRESYVFLTQHQSQCQWNWKSNSDDKSKVEEKKVLKLIASVELVFFFVFFFVWILLTSSRRHWHFILLMTTTPIEVTHASLQQNTILIKSSFKINRQQVISKLIAPQKKGFIDGIQCRVGRRCCFFLLAFRCVYIESVTLILLKTNIYKSFLLLFFFSDSFYPIFGCFSDVFISLVWHACKYHHFSES